MVKVSVVTVFYNRSYAVAETIETLLGQTLEDIEIILVDDGSQDDTLAIASAYRDPRLKIVSHANIGFTASITRGVEAASAEYIAIHGSGDVSLPTRLRKQADLLDRDPQAAVVGCAIRQGDVDCHPPGWGSPVIQPLRRQAMKQNPFSHGEVMFRASTYRLAGGYRDTFRYAQDRDLWLRMGLHGGYLIHPDVLYVRRTPSDGISLSPEKLILQKRFAAFAVQCARRRRQGSQDMVDEYGHAALLYARYPLSASLKLLRFAVGFARRGDDATARRLVEAVSDDAGEVAGPWLRLLGGMAINPMLRPAWRLQARGLSRIGSRNRDQVGASDDNAATYF